VSGNNPIIDENKVKEGLINLNLTIIKLKMMKKLFRIRGHSEFSIQND